VRWLATFWSCCNWPKFRGGQASLSSLNESTVRLFDELEVEGLDFEVHKKGVLMVYLHRADLEHEAKELEPQCDVLEVLEPAQIRQLEPTLSSHVAGGILLPRERHVDPVSLTASLCTQLHADGVSILTHTRVCDFSTHGKGGRVVAVVTPDRSIQCSGVVIAAGVGTRSLAAKLGVRLPIEAGKGYSLDYRPSPVTLNYALHLNEGKVAVSPFNDHVRLAGTMELSGINATVSPRRVSAIARSMQLYIDGWPSGLAQVSIGTGLRPMTPDGLPVIGRVPRLQNVFVASGHGMLGVTLAPGTGEALADLIASNCSSDVLEPFTPARFERRTRRLYVPSTLPLGVW
jgi:D-amino-acid dehydrogenase